jgi:4-aminobutyrate aminotransferase
VCAELDRIAPVAGRARSFLTNCGTEAVEAALKLARHNTGRQYVIAFLGGFHGRSYGSVSLTASKSLYRATFGPLLPGIIHAPYGNAWRPNKPGNAAEFDGDYLEDVLFRRIVRPDEVAAVVVEPIQGEGGYVLPPEGWLQSLRELCDRHGILLVCDEVQSGMGRSGTMWAIEQEGVSPDIVTAGKGIASGLPLGAMIARGDVMSWEPGAHGSTYGGSPVPCAAALATLDVIHDEGLMDNATRVGEVFLAGLRDVAKRHPVVTDVRGRALWIGLSFADHDTAAAVEQACFHRGLLALGCGDDAIRISPPLVFREDQARAALEVFEEAVAEVGSAGA